MADKEVIIDIKVDYAESIDRIAQLRKESDALKASNERLKKEYKEDKISVDEYNKSLSINKIEIDKNSSSIRVLEKEVKNEIKTRQSAEDSLVGLRSKLSNVTAEYDRLSKAEREGAKGQELQQNISATVEELSKAEEATGRYQRSIGDYEGAINKALSAGNPFVGQLMSMATASNGVKGALSSATTAVQGFSKQLLALLANPIIAILAAIAAGLMLMAKALKSSDQAGDRLNVVLAPLNRTLDFLMKILQGVLSVLLSAVEGFSKLANGLLKMAEYLPFVGGAFKDMNDEIARSIQLEKDKAAIEDRMIANVVTDSKARLEIAKLNAMFAEKDKYTAEQRLAFIDKASKLEEESSLRAKAIAEEKLRIREIELSRTQNTRKEEEELANLRAGVFTAETEHFEKMRGLNKRRSSAAAEIKSEEKAASDERKRANDQAISEANERISKEKEAVRAAQDALISLIKDGAEQQRQSLIVAYNRQIEDLRERLNTEKNLTDKARAAINASILLAEKKLQEDTQKLTEQQIDSLAQAEAKRIELKLASVKKGTEQELVLTLQQLEIQRTAEITANNRLTEELRQSDADINAKYDTQERDARLANAEQTRKALADAATLDWENKIAEAQLRGEETLQIELAQRQSELDSIQQLEGESDAAFKARRLEAEQNYVDAKKAIEAQEIANAKAKESAIKAATMSVIGLLEELGENSRELAIASKVIALGQIAVDTGKAISAGIAAAQLAGPFPANIAAIATTVAAVLANMTTAIKTVKSAKFADGGLVTGQGSGTSDSIPARLSNGESIMTAMATSMFSPILSSLNQLGGGVPISTASSATTIQGEDMLANAVIKGVSALPAPVLGIREFAEVQNSVVIYDQLSGQ